MKPGRAGTMTHDYKRHGTTTLFAALDILEGKVIGQCTRHHRHQDFIRFLNALEAYPAPQGGPCGPRQLHHHKHPAVLAWLANHPRWTFHFTPNSCSWLNAVNPAEQQGSSDAPAGRRQRSVAILVERARARNASCCGVECVLTNCCSTTRCPGDTTTGSAANSGMAASYLGSRFVMPQNERVDSCFHVNNDSTCLPSHGGVAIFATRH